MGGTYVDVAPCLTITIRRLRVRSPCRLELDERPTRVYHLFCFVLKVDENGLVDTSFKILCGWFDSTPVVILSLWEIVANSFVRFEARKILQVLLKNNFLLLTDSSVLYRFVSLIHFFVLTYNL